MTRLNLIFLISLVVCAIGLVTSQYRARQLFAELEQEQTRSKELDSEWGQLQLEQSTWAIRTRVSRIASQKLGMQTPASDRIQIITMKNKK